MNSLSRMRPAALRTYAGAVSGITLLALAGRLAILPRTALWRDEAFTGVVERRDLGPMLSAVRADGGMPLAYLLTHLVTPISTSPAALRFMPALAGTCMVPLVAALARRAAGDSAGLWAAGVAAVLPSLVATSHDARMYALATTLVTATVLAAWRALEHPTLWRLGLVTVAATLALHTQEMSLLPLLALAVAGIGLHARPRAMLAVAGALAAALLLTVPWLVVDTGLRANAGAPFWVRPLEHEELVAVFSVFLSGPGVDQGTPHSTVLQTLQGLALAGGGLAIVGLLATLHRRSRDSRRAVGFLTGISGGALCALIIVSVWHPLLEARYAGIAYGPAVAVTGVGMAAVPWRAVRGALLGLLAVGAVAVVVGAQRTDVPAVAAMLDHRVPESGLVVAPIPDYLVLLYYADPGVRPAVHVVSASPVAWFWGTAVYPPGAVLRAVPPGVAPVFVVSYPGDGPPPLPAGLVARPTRCVFNLCLTEYAAAQ